MEAEETHRLWMEAEAELERIHLYCSQTYPDFPRGKTESLSGWVKSLLRHKVRFTNGDQIFEALRSAEAIEELARKLQVDLSDKAMAEYLRTWADAHDDDDECRLIRDAADILEVP